MLDRWVTCPLPRQNLLPYLQWVMTFHMGESINWTHLLCSPFCKYLGWKKSTWKFTLTSKRHFSYVGGRHGLLTSSSCGVFLLFYFSSNPFAATWRIKLYIFPKAIFCLFCKLSVEKLVSDKSKDAVLLQIKPKCFVLFLFSILRECLKALPGITNNYSLLLWGRSIPTWKPTLPTLQRCGHWEWSTQQTAQNATACLLDSCLSEWTGRLHVNNCCRCSWLLLLGVYSNGLY